MLQQILRDMFVDPEILAELDEDQKQTLFCKMREEQVRRWKNWDDKADDDGKTKTTNKKSVNFLKGSDGEPWVWVMGEHETDKSIDDILRDEAIDRARQLAQKETDELRKQVESQMICDYIDMSPKIEEIAPPPKLAIEDDMDIYCSIEEIQKKIVSKPTLNNYSLNQYPSRNNKISYAEDRGLFPEISPNTQKVAQRVALWEKRLNERTSEIFQTIQRKQRETAKEAEEEEKNKEVLWREQERKAKQAEQQIREIARRAREEHRLTSDLEINTAYGTVNSGVPPGRNAVLEWYRCKEMDRSAGLDASNNVETWFHGLITRPESEKLLMDHPHGTFLVRLSERIWGYAISYRAKDKCKHYLVNAMPKYHFVGNNQTEHNSLGELVTFHQKQPLTGGDTLKYPCPHGSTTAIQELFDSK